MTKRISLSLAVLGLFTASSFAEETKAPAPAAPAPAAAAPATPASASPAAPAAPSTTAPAARGRARGQRPAAVSPDERIKEMKEKLGLTDEQAAKVKPILEKNQAKLQELRKDTTTSNEDKRAKYREATKAVMEEVAPILTPEQQAKWKEQMQQRRGGARASKQ